MKTCLFILSHLGADSSVLFKSLDKNPMIQGYNTEIIYDHPEALENLTSQGHKLDNSSAIYMEELLYNHFISSKHIYKLAKFIVLIRQPKESLNEIVYSYDYTPYDAFKYYCYRLRRIAEMSKVIDGIFVTWEHLGKQSELISKYLDISPLQLEQRRIIPRNLIPTNLIDKAQERFEWYHYFIKQHLVV